MHETDHSSLKFMLIDQNHGDLLKCDKFLDRDFIDQSEGA